MPDAIGLRIERVGFAIGSPFREAIIALFLRRQPVDFIGRRLRFQDVRQVIDHAHWRIALELV